MRRIYLKKTTIACYSAVMVLFSVKRVRIRVGTQYLEQEMSYECDSLMVSSDSFIITEYNNFTSFGYRFEGRFMLISFQKTL